MGCGSSHEQARNTGTARAAVKKSSTLGRSRTDRSIVRQSLSKINIGMSEEDVDERDLDYKALEGLEWIGEVRGPQSDCSVSVSLAVARAIRKHTHNYKKKQTPFHIAVLTGCNLTRTHDWKTPPRRHASRRRSSSS